MKDYRQQKNGLPFPLSFTICGSECINISHGGTSRICSDKGIKIPLTDLQAVHTCHKWKDVAKLNQIF